MKARNKHSESEPLLNAVARKLGHAAGAVSKMTHELTETLSGVPEAVTAKIKTKMRNPARLGTSAERQPSLRSAKRRGAKESLSAARKGKAKRTPSTAKKRSSGAAKSSRIRRKANSVK
jgi:hypothetical protein